MVVLGLVLGIVGTDVNSGVMRFTFGIPDLADGIGFVALAMGMFGIAEIVYNLEQRDQDREVVHVAARPLLPTREDLKLRISVRSLRGTVIGSVLGILPGGGALLSSFASYTIEKKICEDAERFGEGAIEGVAGPESANNAGAQTSFIPMLTLGIPANPVMALMIGALIIQGIQPGPQVVPQPDLFWGIIVSMWIGNLFLLVLNLPLIGLWVRLLAVPYRFLFPAILVFCCIGVYTINNNVFDVWPAGRVRRPATSAQARLRARADDPRLRARSDDGGVPAPRAADLARRSDDPGDPPHQPRVPGSGRADADLDRGAGDPPDPRGGGEGIVPAPIPVGYQPCPRWSPRKRGPRSKNIRCL